MKMLIDISKQMIPEVFETIYRMGHRDELVIADANYYASAMSKKLVYSNADNNSELLSAILKYFPLDDDEEFAVNVMTPDHGYTQIPEIWGEYEAVLKKVFYNRTIILNKISRQEFYTRSKNAYATIQTYDLRLYADIIIRKGVVLGE
jgi:L-fucose mutarotase